MEVKQIRPKTEREIKFKLNYLAENLTLDHGEVLQMLEGVMRENLAAVQIMLKNEGKLKGFQTTMKTITDLYLSELPYTRMKKYLNKPVNEWDFLTQDKRNTLDNLNELYKLYGVNYIEDKSDLMIFRKTLLYFIKNKLDRVNKYVDVSDILFTLTDEYSYDDTLVNYGFSPILGNDGLPSLDRLHIDKERHAIVPIDETKPWIEVRVGKNGEIIQDIYFDETEEVKIHKTAAQKEVEEKEVYEKELIRQTKAKDEEKK